MGQHGLKTVEYDDAPGGGMIRFCQNSSGARFIDPRAEPEKRLMVAVLEEAIALVVNDPRRARRRASFSGPRGTALVRQRRARRAVRLRHHLRHPGTGQRAGAPGTGHLGQPPAFVPPPALAGRTRPPSGAQRRTPSAPRGLALFWAPTTAPCGWTAAARGDKFRNYTSVGLNSPRVPAQSPRGGRTAPPAAVPGSGRKP